MVLLRALALTLVACALAAPPAGADAEHAGAPTLPEQVAGARVVVHWSASGPHATTPDAAQRVHDEAAYALELYTRAAGAGGLGLASPPPDADGRIDIYIAEFASPPGSHTSAAAVPDVAGATTSSGWIVVRPAAAAVTTTQTVAHEVMHLVQFATSTKESRWLLEATANWAAARAAAGRIPDDTALPMDLYRFPGIPFDCAVDCGAPGAPGGYGSWPFLQTAAERTGDGVVAAILQRSAELAADGGEHGLQAVAEAFAARGDGLAAAHRDHARRMLTGAWAFPLLRGRTTTDEAFTRTAGAIGDDGVPDGVASPTVAVDHLAVRVGTISAPASASTIDGCPAGTLRVSVDLPPGEQGAPAALLQSSGAADGVHDFAVAGARAELAVPWNCTSRLRLALANTAVGGPAQPFTVHAAFELPEPAPAPERFTATLRGKVIAVRKGVARVRVRMPAPPAAGRQWRGTVSLLRKTGTARRPRLVSLGRQRFTAKRAKTVTIAVRLSRRGRAAMRQSRRLKITLRLDAKAGSVALQRLERRVTLKR